MTEAASNALRRLAASRRAEAKRMDDLGHGSVASALRAQASRHEARAEDLAGGREPT